MGNLNRRAFVEGFGVGELGEILFPPQMSNVRLSRLEHAREMGGCSHCYPHGWETSNATCSKNRRSWKYHRRTQYRPRPA